MHIYNEQDLELIAKLLGKSLTATFSKWVDIKLDSNVFSESGRKRIWTKTEDETIRKGVEKGMKWTEIAKDIPLRNDKQIR